MKRTIFGETNTVIHRVFLLQRAFVGMGAVREQTLQLDAFCFHLMWCMCLDEQFSKVEEHFEELEGGRKLFKVKYFKYRWSLYYNNAAFYFCVALSFPHCKVPCCTAAGLTAPRSADVLGNLRSYLGLSFEEV